MNGVLLLTTKTRAWTSLEGMLARHLPEHGIRPVLVSAEHGELLDGAAAMGAIGCVMPALRDVRTLGGRLRLPGALWTLRRLAREHGVAVVHSLHGSTTPAALLISRLTGLPHLCHMQFLYSEPAKYRKLRLHRARHVVAITRAVLASYRAACPSARPGSERVIPLGLDAEAFVARGGDRDVRREHDIGAGEVLVLMVGSLDARKDPQTLLRAVALARRDVPTIRVLLVGPFREPTYRRETLALGQALGDGVCIVAGVQRNPSAFFRAADIFALPTRGEAQGLVFLEAMAHGKPVVGGRVGGVPEVVDHEGNGLLVPPGDVQGLATALTRLARDEALRRRLGARGRHRVAEEFSAGRMVHAIVKAYRDVARSAAVEGA